MDNKKDIIEEKKNNDEYITIKISELSKFLFEVFLMLALTFQYIELKEINQSINELNLSGVPVVQNNVNNTVETDDEYSEVTNQVLSLQYTQDHMLDVANMSMPDMFTLEENSEYFVFFYMNSCGYCHMTMPSLLQYIETGMTDNANLYFAEIGGSYADHYWSQTGEETAVTPDEFRILGTPTLLHVNNGQYEYAIGPDEIAVMLGL